MIKKDNPDKTPFLKKFFGFLFFQEDIFEQEQKKFLDEKKEYLRKREQEMLSDPRRNSFWKRIKRILFGKK